MKKYFLLLAFLIFGFDVAYASSLSLHIEEHDGVKSVVGVDGNGTTEVIGRIETIPKGTLLFHWQKGTSEQAERWDREGHISKDLIGSLRAKRGFSGGGFYVSENVVDSAHYGDVLIVAEAPKDFLILKPQTYFSSDAWNIVIPLLEAKGISGVSVSHTSSWINIVDAEVLSKTHVVFREAELERFKIPDFLSPLVLEKFMAQNPSLKQKMQSALLAAQASLKLVEVESAAGQAHLEFLSKEASFDSLGSFMAAAAEKNISGEVLENLVDRSSWGAFESALSKIQNDEEKMRRVLLKANGMHEYMLERALQVLERSPLTNYQKTGILQQAIQTFGENGELPLQISRWISLIKYTNKWEPHPLCREVFSN